MARQKGSSTFAGTLEILAGGPIDARAQVPTKADLYIASNFPYPYVGMATYVVSEGKVYRLTGGLDVTVAANWVEEGSGGGSYIEGDGIAIYDNVIRTDDTVYRTPDQTSTDLADADYIPFYDVSASGKKKSTWSNIKTLLANIFQSKLTFGDGINIDQSNEISTERMESIDLGDLDLDGAGQPSGMVIDLDGNELVVGTVIDNGVRKPLYQKTWAGLNITLPTNKMTFDLTGITNIPIIDTVYSATIIGVDNSYMTSQIYSSSRFDYIRNSQYPNGLIRMGMNDSDLGGKVTCLTLQYTKTT